MSAREPRCVVVTDADVIINLIHINRLGLLGALSGYVFVVPPEVEAEISVPDHSLALNCALDAGHVQRRAFTTTAELRLYAEQVKVIGSGEAACLAMAEVHGWHVASDERQKFRRLSIERLGTGRALNTPGILLLAIRAHLITIEEADNDKLVLAEHRFKMRFSSFLEVIGNALVVGHMAARQTEPPYG